MTAEFLAEHIDRNPSNPPLWHERRRGSCPGSMSRAFAFVSRPVSRSHSQPTRRPPRTRAREWGGWLLTSEVLRSGQLRYARVDHHQRTHRRALATGDLHAGLRLLRGLQRQGALSRARRLAVSLREQIHAGARARAAGPHRRALAAWVRAGGCALCHGSGTFLYRPSGGGRPQTRACPNSIGARQGRGCTPETREAAGPCPQLPPVEDDALCRELLALLDAIMEG